MHFLAKNITAKFPELLAMALKFKKQGVMSFIMDSELLIAKVFAPHRAVIYAAFEDVYGEFCFAHHKNTDECEEIAENLNQAVDMGLDATYEPSRRSQNWLNCKDYLEKNVLKDYDRSINNRDDNNLCLCLSRAIYIRPLSADNIIWDLSVDPTLISQTQSPRTSILAQLVSYTSWRILVQ